MLFFKVKWSSIWSIPSKSRSQSRPRLPQYRLIFHRRRQRPCCKDQGLQGVKQTIDARRSLPSSWIHISPPPLASHCIISCIFVSLLRDFYVASSVDFYWHFSINLYWPLLGLFLLSVFHHGHHSPPECSHSWRWQLDWWPLRLWQLDQWPKRVWRLDQWQRKLYWLWTMESLATQSKDQIPDLLDALHECIDHKK